MPMHLLRRASSCTAATCARARESVPSTRGSCSTSGRCHSFGSATWQPGKSSCLRLQASSQASTTGLTGDGHALAPRRLSLNPMPNPNPYPNPNPNGTVTLTRSRTVTLNPNLTRRSHWCSSCGSAHSAWASSARVKRARRGRHARLITTLCCGSELTCSTLRRCRCRRFLIDESPGMRRWSQRAS